MSRGSRLRGSRGDTYESETGATASAITTIAVVVVVVVFGAPLRRVLFSGTSTAASLASGYNNVTAERAWARSR